MYQFRCRVILYNVRSSNIIYAPERVHIFPYQTNNLFIHTLQTKSSIKFYYIISIYKMSKNNFTHLISFHLHLYTPDFEIYWSVAVSRIKCGNLFVNVILYCTVLYCTVLYCTVLYCTVLYCTVLYCTVLYCTVLYCGVLFCSVLYYIALYFIVLYSTVLYCIALYCTVLYCNVM